MNKALKGWHQFMHNKDFHPSNARNLEMVFKAREKEKIKKQREIECAAEYEREQELLNNK
jgi:hypothetical protein